MDRDLVEALTRAMPGVSPEHLADALLLATRAASGRRPGQARQRRRPEADTSGDRIPIDPDQPEPTPEPERQKDPDLTLDKSRNRERERPAPPQPAGGGATPLGLRVARQRRPPMTGALAPFRRITRPGPPAVDVDRSVEAIAEAHRLVVVTAPRQEPGLDVILLVDETPATPAWEPQLNDLESRLRRVGAFRSITRWILEGDARSAPRVRRPRRPGHPPARLADPTGRTLLLIVTDAVSAHWYAAPTWHAIDAWARVMPTSLVQVLPRRHWASTAIGAPAVAVRSHGRREGTLAGEVRFSWWTRDDVPEGRAIPITSCSAPDLHRWARAVTTASGWADAVLSRPPRHAGPGPDGPAASVAQRVQAFHRRASEAAAALARLAAHGDLLSLPLIRVLQEELVPDADLATTSEFLVSGLLERVNPEGTLFRFRPGVTDLLLRGTTLAEEWESFRVLSAHLEQHAGPGDAVHALLADPAGDAKLDRGLRPFAAMTRQMAARLGIALPETMTAYDPRFDWIIEVHDERGRTVGTGFLGSDRSAVIVMPALPESRQEFQLMFPGLPGAVSIPARPVIPVAPDHVVWDLRGPAPTEPAAVDYPAEVSEGDRVDVVSHVGGRVLRVPAVIGEVLGTRRRRLLTEPGIEPVRPGAAVVRPSDDQLIGLAEGGTVIGADHLTTTDDDPVHGGLRFRPLSGDVRPALAKLRVRLFLKAARERAALTQGQLSEVLEQSLSRTIRIENGDVTMPVRDVRPWLAALGVNDRETIGEVVTAARLTRARTRAPWHRTESFRDQLSDAMIKLIDCEAEADEIRLYGIRWLPDLMQTAAYSEARLRLREEDDRPPGWAEVAVRARVRRREELRTRAGGSVRLFALVDESVLRRAVGDPATYLEQLGDLLASLESGSMCLRVAPLSAGAPLYDAADFELVTMAGDDVLYRDLYFPHGEMVEDASTSARIRRKFDSAWRSALSEEDTIVFIRDRIRELE
jgi:transcriptional regulator with XRE-family HTH domain